jgi:hypothetical protein
MIFSDSRYADGTLVSAFDSRKNNYSVGVFRQFPSESSSFYYYTWTASDRIELVALKLLGDVDLWWRILDFNPEINDPVHIVAGTVLRIPRD